MEKFCLRYPRLKNNSVLTVLKRMTVFCLRVRMDDVFPSEFGFVHPTLPDGEA
jgi:hypothetical protein